MLSVVLDWTVTFAALVWLTFLVWYTVRAAWWKNPYGRNAFLVGLVLCLILSRIALSRHIEPFKESQGVAISIYALAALYGVGRIILMERAQRGPNENQIKALIEPDEEDSNA